MMGKPEDGSERNHTNIDSIAEAITKQIIYC